MPTSSRFTRSATDLPSGFNVSKAEWVNILEEPMAGETGECAYRSEGEVSVIDLSLRAFEIRTLKAYVA